jgi:hypothetical protein
MSWFWNSFLPQLKDWQLEWTEKSVFLPSIRQNDLKYHYYNCYSNNWWIDIGIGDNRTSKSNMIDINNTHTQSQGHNNIQSRLNEIWIFDQKMCHSEHGVNEKRIYVCILLFIKKKNRTRKKRESNKKITYILSSRHRSLLVRTYTLILSFSLFF